MAMTGGKALRAKLEEIAKRLNSAGELQVGFFPTATYPDGQSVAVVAAKNEFGVPGEVPARPFFRKTIADHKGEWGDQIGDLLAQTDYDAAAVLEAEGLVIAGQVQKTIRDWTTPPNSAETVARKGFNDPLIDTSLMIRSVTSVVKE